MEYALPELLEREDLLRILQQRRIPGIDGTSRHEQLLQIYKAFAVPLARRDRKSNQKSNPHKRSAPTVTMEVMDVDMDWESNEAFDELSKCQSEKRPLDYEDFMEDERLCSATKRIKIAWP